MESLKAGLATVSTIRRNHVDLEGRVSHLEGKFEQWEEVLHQFKGGSRILDVLLTIPSE